MKRRHVLVGALGAASIGTFVVINEIQQPEEFDGDPGDNETISPLAGRSLEEVDTAEISVEITRESGVRDLTGTVRDALAYWEENASTHVGFDVGYEIVEENPYLTISLVEDTGGCDIDGEERLGCASITGEQFPLELEASVGTSLTDRGVFEVAVHELGHTLGLEHGDGPGYYMSGTRPNIWERERVGVYFNIVGQTSDILDGLSWVSENVEGVVAEFEEATDRNTEVVVERGQTACEDGSVACAERSAEYADQLLVELDPDEDPIVYDWHVARLFAEFAGPIPERLSSETPDEVRRSDWWE